MKRCLAVILAVIVTSAPAAGAADVVASEAISPLRVPAIPTQELSISALTPVAAALTASYVAPSAASEATAAGLSAASAPFPAVAATPSDVPTATAQIERAATPLGNSNVDASEHLG